jgi:hypothetical protein
MVPDPKVSADAEPPKIGFALLHLPEALGGDLQAVQYPAR